MHSVVHHQLTSRPNPLREIYGAISIKSLGLSIFSIFVPIYLSTIGYSLRNILGFMVVDYCFRVGLQPLAGLYISRFGPKHGLVVSAIANIMLLWLFYTLPTYHWPLLLVAIFSAVATVFHFLAYFVDFTYAQNAKETGKEVGVMSQLFIVVTSIGPFVGGLIGSLFGPEWMLIVAIVIVAVSLLPLFRSRELVGRQEFHLHAMPWREMVPDLMSSAGKSFDNRAANIIWPLALYLILQNYAKVGVVTTISFLAVFITARFVSKRADRQAHELVWVGSSVSAGIHVARVLAQSAFSIVSINLLDGVFNWVGTIPWQAQVYRNARSVRTVEYLMLFNQVSDLASVTYFLILFAATFFMSGAQVIFLGFFLGAIGVLLSPLLMRGPLASRSPERQIYAQA